MPEGDTVFRAAAQLRAALVGKTLTRCDIRVPRYATVDLSGQPVDEVLSRGKHLFIRIGEASIHSHLKMDGSWRIGATTIPAHRIRVALATADSTATGIDLGILEVLERRIDQDVVEHLGPDLLGPDWDPQRAAANLIADPDRELADALLDQRVMAGVGNVYANELCFVLGRTSDAAVGTLADPLRVAQRARDMLWLNRSRSNRTTTGNTRRGEQVWVYGRSGQPCRRCRSTIMIDDSGERIRYWCPSCQAA